MKHRNLPPRIELPSLHIHAAMLAIVYVEYTCAAACIVPHGTFSRARRLPCVRKCLLEALQTPINRCHPGSLLIGSLTLPDEVQEPPYIDLQQTYWHANDPQTPSSDPANCQFEAPEVCYVGQQPTQRSRKLSELARVTLCSPYKTIWQPRFSQRNLLALLEGAIEVSGGPAGIFTIASPCCTVSFNKEVRLHVSLVHGLGASPIGMRQWYVHVKGNFGSS